MAKITYFDDAFSKFLTLIAQGVSLWRVKSSGVRQSKICKSLLGIKVLLKEIVF